MWACHTRTCSQNYSTTYFEKLYEASNISFIFQLFYFSSIMYCADCPEEVVMGIVWERSLTNTTYKHKCSDIHPSFKLADMAIRECMKNRSWAPVDMSQCVMVVNSPVVMILVVTLNADNSSEVQSVMDQITSEVCTLILDVIIVICG